MRHELAQLAGKIDWGWTDGAIAPLSSEKDRPGSRRALSSGACCSSKATACPMQACASAGDTTLISSSSPGKSSSGTPSRRALRPQPLRKRLGDKLALLRAESLRVAHESGALRSKDLARVTVDTTVRPKAISFPTDAKLSHVAIKTLELPGSTAHGKR